MGWTQSSSGSLGFLTATSPGTSYTLPGGAPAAGLLEVIFVATSNSVTSISAGGGASWTLASSGGSSEGVYCYYRTTNGSEGTTVNVVVNAANGSASLEFQRWAGVAASSPLDIAVLGSFSGGTSCTATTGAMAATGELLLGFAGLWNTAGGLTASSPSWTAGLTDSGNGPSAIKATDGSNNSNASWCGYLASAGTASLSPVASWTSSWDQTVMILVSFKAAPSLITGPPLNQGQLPNFPAVITSNAGWRNAGHSR